MTVSRRIHTGWWQNLTVLSIVVYVVYMLSIPCEREPVLIRAGPHSVGVGKNTFSRSVAAYFVPEITFIC